VHASAEQSAQKKGEAAGPIHVQDMQITQVNLQRLLPQHQIDNLDSKMTSATSQQHQSSLASLKVVLEQALQSEDQD